MKPKKFTIMPGYFLVRINKEEQTQHKQRISKDSPFFMPVGFTWNSRNMEYGDILQIGADLKIHGWEGCQPGHILIFHHTVEDVSNTANKQFWVFEDEEFNYYAVEEIMVRGYYDGETIMPHPSYVFLKNIPAFEDGGEVDNNTGNKIEKKEGGLYQITNWGDNASNIAQKSEQIKEHIESLAKMTRTDEVQLVMEDLERQRIELNRKAQRKFYLPYRVAYFNPKLKTKFAGIKEDSVLYCYNKACLYMTNFQLEPYKYIICNTDYIAGMEI